MNLFAYGLSVPKGFYLYRKIESSFCQYSDRRNGINSRIVLPHHHTYHPAHGGSLIYTVHFPIMIREESVSCLLKTVVGDRSI